jgi:hypothetical protein
MVWVSIREIIGLQRRTRHSSYRTKIRRKIRILPRHLSHVLRSEVSPECIRLAPEGTTGWGRLRRVEPGCGLRLARITSHGPHNKVAYRSNAEV